MNRVRAIALWVLLATTAFAQAPPDTNKWGTQFNSTGAKLTFRETGRDRHQGKTVVVGNLYATGLPTDGDYVLWMWQEGKSPEGVADAYINAEGKIVNRRADPAHNVSEDPIDLKFLGGKGEAKRLAIISVDDQYRAFIDVVPFPLENTDGNCHLSATTFDPRYFAVVVNGTGFLPNEHLVIDTQSENERGTSKADAGPQGTYTAVVSPFVKGKRSGRARYTVIGAACKVGIEFAWGDGAYQLQ